MAKKNYIYIIQNIILSIYFFEIVSSIKNALMAVVIPMSSLGLESISMKEIIRFTLIIYNHYGKSYWIHNYNRKKIYIYIYILKLIVYFSTKSK